MVEGSRNACFGCGVFVCGDQTTKRRPRTGTRRPTGLSESSHHTAWFRGTCCCQRHVHPTALPQFRQKRAGLGLREVQWGHRTDRRRRSTEQTARNSNSDATPKNIGTSNIKWRANQLVMACYLRTALCFRQKNSRTVGVSQLQIDDCFGTRSNFLRIFEHGGTDFAGQISERYDPPSERPRP